MTNYWAIDVPGLNREGADALAAVARSLSGVLGSSVLDPQAWLTRHLDGPTVDLLLAALRVAVQSGDLSERDAWDVQQLIDDLARWRRDSSAVD